MVTETENPAKKLLGISHSTIQVDLGIGRANDREAILLVCINLYQRIDADAHRDG